jgi:hypothetical protein
LLNELLRFIALHRNGVIESLLAALIVAIVGTVVGVLRRIRVRKVVSGAAPGPLRIVRDIYTGKSGWAPSTGGHNRIIVGASYLVTNTSDRPVLIARAEGEVGKSRDEAALSQFVEWIPAGATVPVTIVFFAQTRGNPGKELLANIIFVDNLGTRYELVGERIRSVLSLS